MNRFLQNFLRETPEKLSEVRRELQILRECDPANQAQIRLSLRRVFQQAHTIKGSAAAFGIETIRGLAHELENLLDRLCFGETIADEAALDALEAGIKKIEIALTTSEQHDPDAMANDLRDLILDSTVNETLANIKFSENNLPIEFLEKLNEEEKRRLQQIAATGAGIFIFGVKFPINEFQEKLQNLRSALERDGEIVAALPGTLTSPAEIALQIVFAHAPAPTNFLEAIKSFNAEILFINQASTLIADATVPAFLAGRRAAIELGKEIEFDVLGGELKITKKQADALTTALLHLVTNAVAHGIESPAERLLEKKQPRATIRVIAEQKPSSVCVSVLDDGCGIDFKKISQAGDQIVGLTSDSEGFNLTEAQKLIFEPGFSTVKTLTHIAGRGVGLDAAKYAVESSGGAIEVSSEIGAGTTFKIIFPQT